jgi:hypothetical protein
MATAPDPILVRWGVRYFRELSKKLGPVDVGDGVHYLNPDERAALRRIERGAIIRAAVAGALSAVVAAVAEVLAQPILGPKSRHATFEQQVQFWSIVGGATALASIVEILYLYWDGLRATHALSRAAGLDLFPSEKDDDAALAGAMARAALELPSPTGRFLGVDPFRESSRFRIVMASVVYKLKISVTNFAVKALVRRMLGRAFVKAWLPFVAVPITAGWNALICWLIMREARIRAMGPSAAFEMLTIAYGSLPPEVLDEPTRRVAVRAVASSIVRTEDMHPNLAAVLREVMERAPKDDVDGEDLDAPKMFLSRLAKLGATQQRFILRVLAIASVIDGRLTRAEKTLLVEAHRTCGLPADVSAVDKLRVAFLRGDPIERERIETL